MPIGERFCLSFSLLRLTENGVGSSRPQTRSVGAPAAGPEAAVSRTSRRGGSLRPLLPACSPLALLFRVPRSLLARLPYGQLGRGLCCFSAASCAASGRVLLQDTQLRLLLRGRGSTAEVAASTGSSENSGVTLHGHRACAACLGSGR